MELTPAARNTDPVSSHLAATEVTVSGEREAQIMQVAMEVKNYIGYTSRELANITGLDRYMLARRLSDAEKQSLVKKGPQRKCSIADRMAITWYPINCDLDDYLEKAS